MPDEKVNIEHDFFPKVVKSYSKKKKSEKSPSSIDDTVKDSAKFPVMSKVTGYMVDFLQNISDGTPVRSRKIWKLLGTEEDTNPFIYNPKIIADVTLLSANMTFDTVTNITKWLISGYLKSFADKGISGPATTTIALGLAAYAIRPRR